MRTPFEVPTIGHILAIHYIQYQQHNEPLKYGRGVANKLTLAQQFPLTASSFPLAVVYGWYDSQRKGLPFHNVSSPRVVTCGRASRFSRQNATRWGSEHSSHFACTRRSNNWICPAKPFTPVLTGYKVRTCSILYRRKAAPCSEPPTLPYW